MVVFNVEETIFFIKCVGLLKQILDRGLAGDDLVQDYLRVLDGFVSENVQTRTSSK